MNALTLATHSGRWLLALTAVLLLSHCARLPQQPEGQVDKARQQQRLEAQQRWQLQAKLGVRTAQDHGSANLRWEQAPEHYRIQLSGPLGQGKVRISGNQAGVTLEQAGKPSQSATSAEQLLYQNTGWRIPIRQLSHWVKSLPAAQLPVRATRYDTHGLRTELHQGGWQLSYSRYQRHGNVYLPGRIVANNTQVTLTLIIHQWHLGKAP